MNILVISREIPPVGGGAGAVALDLATQFAANGHQVRIITMHFGDLPPIETRGSVTIQRLRCGRRRRDSADFVAMGRFVLAARRAARKAVAEGSYDIVHAHGVLPDGLVAISTAKLLRCPVVLTAHGSDVPGYDPGRYALVHRLLGPVWRRLVRGANLVTTPSEYLHGLIRRTETGGDVRVIPNGIQTDLFSISPNRSGFLIASRLIKRKNYGLFFEALHRIRPSQEVRVVGDGPERGHLERLASELDHRVTFLGWLDRGSAEWRHAYEESRFLAFPSDNENFPINLLEAQLAGLVVLANNIQGNREVLGSNALFFSDLTPKGIAATITRAINMPNQQLETLGQRASLRARSFSWPTIALRFEKEYSRLVESNSVK